VVTALKPSSIFPLNPAIDRFKLTNDYANVFIAPFIYSLKPVFDASCNFIDS
jgi:hypothetical protein